MACEAASHEPCRPPARQDPRYIDQHNPQGARNVQKRIQVVMHLLLRHPQAGHTISRPGIRRMVVSPYPYALTYRHRRGRNRHSQHPPYRAAAPRVIFSQGPPRRAAERLRWPPGRVAACKRAGRHPSHALIIPIGSNNGDRIPFPGAAGYAMSKSALRGLARGLARDFGARGITVNVVQPGPTDTDMNPADGPMRDKMHSVMAIQRHATGAEIAAMVAFLVGPDAAMVTGAMHTIDGGFAA